MEVTTLEEIHKFAEQINFRSHALILRPNDRKTTAPIFKGLNTVKALELAFKKCIKYAKEGKLWVETDMRAQFNPSRMQVIYDLAIKLADRLRTLCPKCYTPGWGQIRQKKGLICACCGLETELIKLEIFGCVKCDYEENKERSDGKKKADPANCQYCNP
jgi:hypothetical protein